MILNEFGFFGLFDNLFKTHEELRYRTKFLDIYQKYQKVRIIDWEPTKAQKYKSISWDFYTNYFEYVYI